jgi:diaminopimelate decarboxylase
VGQCGTLVSKVLYIKKGIKTKFAIIDAGMTELIRPALYQASHKILNLSNNQAEMQKYDVVGPICESSDCFGKQISLPKTKRGDCIAILSCGAYGQVMGSNYNLRSSIKEVYSEKQ